MTDINKLIEDEAERSVQIFSEDQRVSRTMKRVGKRELIQGASFILHLNRWRKVGEVLLETDSYFLIRSPNASYRYVARYYPEQKRFVDTRGHSIYYSNNLECKPIE